MALADYKLCDNPEHVRGPNTSEKTFYDSDVNYEDSYCGDLASLCRDCAKKFAVRIVPREPSDTYPWWIQEKIDRGEEW